MNVYDSARMAEILAPLGYAPGENPESADMVILNTCHIREKASEKVYSELGRLRNVKDRRAEEGRAPMVIAVAGCVAQAEGEEMLRRAPFVDIVLGPQAYHRLPEMVARAHRAGADGGVLNTDFPIDSKFDHLPDRQADHSVSAFLSIQEGCDKFCTFCVVPYTRGAEFSRPVAQILEEARQLVDGGVRELTLLGQNVNAYHGLDEAGGETGLGSLVGRLADIGGLARIRYTTSHPRDVDASLIDAHGNVDALMPFLHLPVQSGSDRILEAMNRGHDVARYMDIVNELRTARPARALSCDFIVGFPGETETDFEATLDLVRAVGYSQAYSFKFSARPGTPAAGLPRQVPEDVKDARLARLRALLDEQQYDFNTTTVGRTVDVLLERPGRHPGQVVGRTPYNQAVHVTAEDFRVGSIANVAIESCKPRSLAGRVVGPGSAWLGEDPRRG